MLYLLLSIGLSVLLLLNFRLFPRYGVNTFSAIVFNYPVCFLTGWLLMPKGQSFGLDFGQTWTWLALGLGVGFIITFLLSGASTQRVGITATSLANNLSLVIPVSVSLLVLNPGSQSGFNALNYLGLALGLVAVGLSTYKKETGEAKSGGWSALLPVSVFLLYGLTNSLINYMNVRYIPTTDQTARVTLTMVLGAIAAGLLMWGVRLAQGKEKLEARTLVAALTLGIPNYLSFYTLLMALSAYGGNGAFVYPLYNIGVILLSAGVGTVFFREKLLTLNKIGLALAIVAIGLISWPVLLDEFILWLNTP